jgi:hypothetical protein
VADVLDLAPPDLTLSDSVYARVVAGLGHAAASQAPFPLVGEGRGGGADPLRNAARLALTSSLRPQVLDCFYTRNQIFDRRFTEFGGLQGREPGFVPTGETRAFVLGGADLERRFVVHRLLDPGAPLHREGLVIAAPEHPEQATLRAPLLVPEETLARLTGGREHCPACGAQFPAQHLETARDWGELVLHPGTLRQLEEVRTFVDPGHTLMHDWGMAAKLRPGLRCLFHGPPGTGKTLSASLLGKQTGREVYRIDLSLVISKYIGETEKNLARVFDRAQRRDWILFFDEAEALFGKRSETRDAHDRYANQEIAFLLQRVETFDGIAILATNLRANIDEAFARRFELVVYFPPPRSEERLRLWREGLSPRARLADDVDLERMAREHELTGGHIMNVIRQVSLAAIAADGRAITAADLEQAIRRELAKEGRPG